MSVAWQLVTFYEHFIARYMTDSTVSGKYNRRKLKTANGDGGTKMTLL